MGTNYYAVKKLPNSIKGKICDLIENDLYEEANEKRRASRRYRLF